MPYQNIELPADFHVPRINDRPQDKRLANLRFGPGTGRRKGSLDKINRDLKNGIIDAAIAHGADGNGAGGLQGYLYLLAAENRKTFAYLLGKLMPYNVAANVSSAAISEVRIISVPAGSHFTPAALAAMECKQDLASLSADVNLLEPMQATEVQVPVETIVETVPELAPDPARELSIREQARVLGYEPLPPRLHRV